MAFEKYGGYIWSDEPAYQERDWRMQGLTLGMLAAVGTAAASKATQIRPDGTRILDDVATYARTGGNLLPFQLGNTYRIPEFVSPFTSPAYQGLESIGDGRHRLTIQKEYLGGQSTYHYIKQLTGLSESEMAARGFKIGGDVTETASSLVFERTTESATGSLYATVGGEKRLLSNSVMLQQFTGESPDLINIVDKTKSVNRAAHATMQAMDMWSEAENFDPGNVFRRVGEVPAGEMARPKFFPVPAVTTDISSLADLRRSSTLLRAVPAFSMERFNRLIGGVSEELFGKKITEFGRRVIGAGPGVTPGPAGAMYMRFGGKAAALMGIGVGVQQADWFRRQAGLPGELAVSAGMGAGVSWLAKKAGLSKRTALFAGVASFAGQMILPGFEQGVIPGIATSYARMTELRASGLNPFNYYRRTLEGFVPGASDWKMGALLGIGAVAASYGNLADIWDPLMLVTDAGTRGKIPMATLPLSGKPIAQHILDTVGSENLGLESGRVRKSVRQIFWDRMLNANASRSLLDENDISVLAKDYDAAGGYLSSGTRMRLMAAYRSAKTSGVDLRSHMNQMWAEAEELHKNLAPLNPMGDSLKNSLDTIGAKYSGKEDLFSKIGMQVEGLAAQWKHAFFGADLGQKELAQAIKDKGFKAPLGRFGLIFAGTALGHQLVTGGLFGSMETSQELRDIYEGKELVEVGKSRWWEGGGTPFEGSKTSYYRPHWYALMMNRVREKGIWGEDEDTISPIGKFLRKNLTYELERRNYYERPYPISSAAFSDIPIIGGALAATVGRVFKPPRLMHTGEWIRPEGEEGFAYGDVYQGWRREPAYNLGAIEPGIPSSPFSPANQLSYLNYQFRELEGMTGWTKNVLSDLFLGTDTYGIDRPQLQDAGYMTSHRLRFWENAMGGGFFMNEALRRVFPNYRREIERQNPVMNSMPAWIPERFRYGDPYRAVEWGEARMPGAGYAALHPELRGVDPEDYPLIYQYDILANVAPFSKEFRRTRQRIYKQRAEGMTTEGQNAFMDRIDTAVRERYNIYDFDRVHDNAIQLPGSSITQSAYFYAQKTLRKTVAPVEYMVPMGFRPIQKLMGERDPIERYEYERLYGTPMAFWDQPWRDWFRPTIYSTLHMMGFEGKPAWRQEADANAAYFDQLEFEKWMRLAEEAGRQGRSSEKIRYQYMAGTTRMGVNPQGNPLSIYWTLPAEERAYFNSFAYAQGRDRERIREMVPADQVHLYEAVWNRLDEGDPELFPSGYSGPDAQHLRDQFYGMNESTPAPPEDWIGWHEDVDIRDIRVRYVNELGRDLHDYGLWENQLRDAMRQPYLEGSTDFLHGGGGISREKLGQNLYRMFNQDATQPNILVNSSPFTMSHVDLEYTDYRDSEIAHRVREQQRGW